jgi:hypothetical protein
MSENGAHEIAREITTVVRLALSDLEVVLHEAERLLDQMERAARDAKKRQDLQEEERKHQ